MPFLRRHTGPRWPPSPLVEDEYVSLSRELHGFSNLGEKPGLEGVCARGTINQEPMILDLDRSSTPPPLVHCTENCSSDEGNGPPTPPPIDVSRKPFFPAIKNLSYEAWPMSPRAGTPPPQSFNFGDLSNIVAESKRGSTRPRSSKEQVLPTHQRPIPTSDRRSNPITVKPNANQACLPRGSPTRGEQSPDALSFSRKMEERFKRYEQRRAPRIEEQSSRESLRSAATDSFITPFPKSIKMPAATERFFMTQSSSAPQSPIREHHRMSPRSSRTFDLSTPPSPRRMSSNVVSPSPRRTVSFPDEVQWIHAAPGRRVEFSPRASPRPSPRASPAPARRSSSSLESKRPPSSRTSDLRLSPCPRSVEMPGHQDWSTIRGFDHLHVCPSCTKNISNSKFGSFVVPSVPKTRTDLISCSFSDPWVRLAWFQTIKEDLNHLDILYKITRGTRICPGRDKATEYWYKVVDPETKSHLPGFNACPACVRNLRILMPTLRYAFKRSTVKDNRSCDFVTDSPRFVKYIDLLDRAANRAEREIPPRAKIPEFIAYARRKTALPECRRDRPKYKTWHYIPQLPEFTVCEDCYEDVVWPFAQDDEPIANKFTSTPRLLPGNDKCREATCQLYSPRMRAKFKDSVQRNDFGFLKAAVLKRYDAEQVYQARRSKLLGQWDRGYDVDLDLRRNKVPWRNGWE